MIQVSENKINNNKEKFLTVKDVRSIKSLQKFKPNFQKIYINRFIIFTKVSSTRPTLEEK